MFGRTESRIARSGQRFLQYRLFELESGRAERGDGAIRLQGNDLVAALASEARYVVVNESQPVRLVYTPLLGRGEPARSTPITFAIGVNGTTVHQHDVIAGAPSRPMSVALPGTDRMRRLVLSLTARDGTIRPDAGGRFSGGT